MFELAHGTSTITTLASFDGNNGANPLGSLVQDSSGNLFGTAFAGGAIGYGTVFELAHGTSTITALASFDNINGASPYGRLVEDSSGNLFGAASSGGDANGDGTVFELAQGSSTLTVLASFNNANGDGSSPLGGLVEDSSGNLFGTARNGGANNKGTIFEVAHGSNTITVLTSFDNTNGANPYCDLVADSSGNFFGTTQLGGANGSGTVFELIQGPQGPSISTQPQNATVTAGQTASVSLAVAASGGAAPYSYQWQISTNNGVTFTNLSNGSGVAGANTGTLTLSGFATAGSPEYRAIVTDANNVSAISTAATLTINTAPSITAQPQNATATVGQTASDFFTIADSGGSTPLTVQWQISTNNGVSFTNLSNGNGVAGATLTTLTVSSFASAGSPEYRAIVTDASNVSAISNAATLTVNAAPSVTTQPASQSATTGQTGSESFSVVAANGTTPFTYRWQVSTNGGSTFSNVNNVSGISGATTATLTIKGSSLPASGTQYKVVVTDANGVMATSTAAALTVNAAPAITTQPHNATATVGQSASESFTIVDGGGTTPLAVQWQISTNNGVSFTNLSNGSGVAGATTTTLTVSGFAAAGSPEYRVIVTDANNVSATSNPATLAVNAAPSVTTQPASQSATTGQTGSESFSVVAANGTTPFTYQWQVSTNGGNSFSNVNNGSGISGATTATLTISSSSLPASGTEYQVVVTDANGVTTTSTAAALTVNAAPAITTQAHNATATLGQPAAESFTVADGGGTTPLAVQWQISMDNGVTFTNLSNGSGVAGATATTLSVNGFATAGSRAYRAIVTDANNVLANSNTATLTVNAAPSITTQPASQSAATGQMSSESFSVVAANGTTPFTYQWQVSANGGNSFSNVINGSGISGATTATLTISSTSLPVSGTEYKVVVIDANGVMVTSTAATLTINAGLSITTQPHNATATVGQTASASFTIAASGGTTPLAVHWQISTDNGLTFTSLSNGSGVAGATTTTLTVGNFATAGSRAYRAVVTDANNVSATSTAATLTINAAPITMTPNQSWLTQVYADFFKRALDPSGLTTWGNLLNQGVSRTQVVRDIQSGIEYRTHEVQGLYGKLLHRAADSSGLNAFAALLGNGGTAEQVEAAILGSPEYLYQDVLNRQLDASGARSWGLELASGITRDVVVAAILASPESVTDEVQSLFNEFLHRPADASGMASFTTALQHGATSDVAIAGIVGSEEYFARAQQGS